jgi:carbamoyl-phosphate synthase small subunit
MYIYLEDGSVFQGRGITASCEAVGLVSYYTGVVGYQELISDPANHGKILLFTYPEIGNYGVNSQDGESDAPVVSGIIAKEYCPYYSNFRAEKSLKEYLDASRAAFLDGVDTRAFSFHFAKRVRCGVS